MARAISGIYQITNIQNGYRYIGSSINIYRRWREHKQKLNRNKHVSKHLQSAWQLYGETSFEFSILCECLPQDLLTEEQKRLDFDKPEYNLCQRAGNTLGVSCSEETKQKISKLAKARCLFGENNPNFGNIMSEEAKARISAANKGKKRSFTEEHKQKIAAGLKDKPKTEEHKEKCKRTMFKKGQIPWNKGKKHTEETKQKIRDAKKLKPL